jgi:hypothetical protein
MASRKPGTSRCINCTRPIETKHRRWWAQYCPGRRCRDAMDRRARKIGREIIMAEIRKSAKSA